MDALQTTPIPYLAKCQAIAAESRGEGSQSKCWVADSRKLQYHFSTLKASLGVSVDRKT
jgi:hypothetical protein